MVCRPGLPDATLAPFPSDFQRKISLLALGGSPNALMVGASAAEMPGRPRFGSHVPRLHPVAGWAPENVSTRLAAAVEIDPQSTIIRFTRRVFHREMPKHR
jgi:hypothetical protein